MSSLQEKLRENKNKIKREKFLSATDPKFSNFLASAEVSNDVSCLKYAAFSIWDVKAHVQTTSRDKVTNWNNFTFKTWDDLISALKRFQKIKNYIGWFFIDTDGPYYKISVNAFLSHIQSIAKYGINHEHYDFGWVGGEDDVGIIIEHHHESPSGKDFGISVWGI